MNGEFGAFVTSLSLIICGFYMHKQVENYYLL